MSRKISKQQFLLVIVASLLLLLPACSTKEVENKGTTINESTTQTEQSKQTKIVTTIKGEVEVPVDPQRIISTYGIGDLVALGANLVATYDVEGSAFVDEVAHLPVWEKFEKEDIMAHDPDLIFVIAEEQYETVSKIAPTILIPFTEMSMEERITFLSEIIGKEQKGREILADFNKKIDAAKKQLEAKGIYDKTFTLMEGGDGSVWVFGDKWGRGGDLIYKQLGLKAPEIIESEIIHGDQYRDLSLEVINDYAGDYILYSGDLGNLEANPVWQALPAVKAGNIIYIDHALFFNIDIFSTSVQLDYIMEQFADR